MVSGVRTRVARLRTLGRFRRLFGVAAGSPSIDPSADPATDAAFPEIGCVRGRLSAPVIANAELRAERLALGADRVLIATGALDEETYLRALGDSIGVTFEPLDSVPRAQCPLDDDRRSRPQPPACCRSMPTGGRFLWSRRAALRRAES